MHDLLSEIKVKQKKLLEATALDLTLEKTQVVKYNSKSGKKSCKFLKLSQDIEEIQWSNSIDSIKYSSRKNICKYSLKRFKSQTQGYTRIHGRTEFAEFPKSLAGKPA